MAKKKTVKKEKVLTPEKQVAKFKKLLESDNLSQEVRQNVVKKISILENNLSIKK